MLRDPIAEAESSRHWTGGLFGAGWSDEERTYATLLDALARERVENDAAALEMDTRARRSMADVKEEEAAAAADEFAEARQQLQRFRDALQDARARSAGNTAAEVPYDSAVPTHDALVDVLIQYLVRTGYAEVRTEEPEPEHYIYHLRIGWDRLRDLAEREGRPLPIF